LIRVHQSIVNESKAKLPIENIIEVGQDLFGSMVIFIERIHKSLPLDLPLEKSTILAYLYFYYGEGLYKNKKLYKKYQLYLQANGLIIKPKLFIPVETGFGSVFSRYFRNIYQIYKYIDSAKYLDYDTRYYYSKIVRSVLSTVEQNILFYNILSPMGKAWISEKLVFKYKPIKNMSLEENRLYSPVSWLRSLNIEDLDQDYIYNFFEYYDNENNGSLE